MEKNTVRSHEKQEPKAAVKSSQSTDKGTAKTSLPSVPSK